MPTDEIRSKLNQISMMSCQRYGSYSYVAGFYESMLHLILSGAISHDSAISQIDEWIANHMVEEV